MPATVRTPVGNAPIIPVIISGSGFYIAWFAIRYWADTATIWPTTPVKAVLTGKPLPAPSGSPTAAQVQSGVEGGPATGAPGSSVLTAGVTAGSETQNGTAIYKYLRGAGWRPIQAAGATCSMWGESSWNPESSVIDSNGLPSQGIMQWNGGNYQTYVGAPKPTGNPTADLQAQLPAIISYTNGRATGPSALIMMSTLTSILQASQIFSTQVEGAGISDAHTAGAQATLAIVNAVDPGTGLTV